MQTHTDNHNITVTVEAANKGKGGGQSGVSEWLFVLAHPGNYDCTTTFPRLLSPCQYRADSLTLFSTETTTNWRLQCLRSSGVYFEVGDGVGGGDAGGDFSLSRDWFATIITR